MYFYRQKRILYHTILQLLFILTLPVACDKQDPDEGTIRNVCIIYSAGYSDLSTALTEDLADIATKGFVPKRKGADVLLVISQRTAQPGDYITPTAPCLYRIYKHSGKVIRDTLFSMDEGVSPLEADAMRVLLGKAGELFPARHYGMVFSSHGSGWLPPGFFRNPDISKKPKKERHASWIPVPDSYFQDDSPGFILTKAAGAEYHQKPGEKERYTVETEIQAFAASIPMHLDYLLFDACLMGGVEVAWALREVADYIGFSQTEILSEGFDYTSLTGHLLQATPDPTAVCDDFYQYYEKQTGIYRSATISLIRTSELEALARACRPLFERYRAEISALKPSEVQGFGGAKRYFFDLADILEKAGASAEEMAGVQDALDRCITYKNHTEKYYSDNVKDTLPIHAFCGLSMYLPSPSVVGTGKAYLDEYYRTLGWNQATELVK